MKGIEEKQIEAPYELPEGWKWIPLLKSFENKTSSNKKLPTKDYSDAGKYAIIDQGQEFIGGYSDKTDFVFDGELPIIVFGDHTKCIKYIDFPFIQGADGVKILKPISIVDSKYFYYALQNIHFPDLGYRRHFPIFKDYQFPLPPTLDEQQRLVNRIESMFAKLDEAKEKAQNVVDGFETRKAAILHKAFTGELTAKWRKENNPEESSKYLEKIKDKVEIRLDFKYWENTKLPESWCESTIGNLLYFAGRVGWKGLKAEEYTSEGPILLSVYNLNDGDEVSFNKINHITNERYDESPEIMVRKNDILLTKDGAGIGKLGYVNELSEKATINSSLLLIRPGDVANYKFIFYLLSGPALQNIVKERITGSATPHLFQRDIKEFVLPVPSLPEQQEIVRILDTVLEKESRAKEAAQTVIAQIALLKKSILARAFRGEL
ncbi:MAG: restriction endonuclease subunit S [Treponema sp.]|nr:restriction endonuclease subunit S [Treponema sp.]